MKQNYTLNIRKAEIWISTLLYLFSLAILANQAIANNFKASRIPHHYNFHEKNIPVTYFANYFFPSVVSFTAIYLAFLLINFKAFPLFQKGKTYAGAAILLVTYILTSIIHGVCATWLDMWQFSYKNSLGEIHNIIFFKSFVYILVLLGMLTLYHVVKIKSVPIARFAGRYIKTASVLNQINIAILFFFLVTLFLNIPGIKIGYRVIWLIFAPPVFATYFFCFHYFIPKVYEKGFWKYEWKMLLYNLLFAIPWTIFWVAVFHDKDVVLAGLLCFFLLVVVAAPACWFFYEQKNNIDRRISGLTLALGTSTSKLQFLRSQINPHFLFNALNTLYGTALQEHSERTAQGIQKLGDMMRFMLFENGMDKILLQREIEYVNNYIDLQKLRTGNNENISIETDIAEVHSEQHIAPMLLIPFIENAFKHGISLQSKSWIKIHLALKENLLYFDINNSTHPKLQFDTENSSNGIGLENVKERLTLLYPGHELIIRQSSSEYFVHLTIDLS